jgi:hypothetical protein
MADILRAYRRWLARRLSYLLPIFALALGLNAWLAVGVDSERWLKAISLVLSGICLAFLGYLLFETLACAALQARGERRAARTLRTHLAISWRIAAVCVVVFAVLIVAPYFARTPGPEAPREARLRRSYVQAPDAAPAEFTQTPPVKEAPPALAAAEPAAEPPQPAPPRPDIVPPKADVPPRLVMEEKEFGAPLALAPFLRPPQEPARTPEPDPLSVESIPFRPEMNPPAANDPLGPGTTGVDRPGLRGEESDELPAPTLRLDVLLFSMEGYGRGGGAGLEGDYPLSRDGSLHVSYFGIGFGKGKELDELQSEWVWHRLTLGYLHRLAGFTRHAGFDLAITIGASVDRFANEVGPEEIDTKARISPYVAVDVGIWQGGPFGFVLHAGQSIPFNMTGSSSAVTDVSATLRVDLSERLSLFAGYRMLWVELKEYPENLVASHAHHEFDSTLAGPLVGLELRF